MIMKELYVLTKEKEQKLIGTKRHCQNLKRAILHRSKRTELENEDEKNFKIKKLC